jgi:hypothetical protein
MECGTVFKKPPQGAPHPPIGQRPAAPAPRPPTGQRPAVPMQPPVPPPVQRPAAPAPRPPTGQRPAAPVQPPAPPPTPVAPPTPPVPDGAPPASGELKAPSLAADPIKPEAKVTAEQSAAAARAVIALTRRERETRDRSSPVSGVWRPSLVAMAFAALSLAAIVGAVFYIQLPPTVPPAPGSWSSEAGRFAVRPPDSWVQATSFAALEEIKKGGAVKAPEWVSRAMIRGIPAVAFVKVAGETDPFPSITVSAIPAPSTALDSEDRRALPTAFAAGLSGLFDAITPDAAVPTTLDGLPALLVTATGQRKTLVTAAATVYREVDGGYEVAGRSDEQWAVRKVRFAHYLVAGHERRYHLTLAAEEGQFHRLDLTFQALTGSFRALVRPPLLPTAFRQLVLSAAGAAGLVIAIYLLLGTAAIFRRRG